MSQHRWVATLLRARQAREDAAAQQLAVAHRDLTIAVRSLRHEDERVQGMSTPRSLTVASFLASMATQSAAGATHAAAAARAGFAHQQVDRDSEQLTVTARARRTVEKLSERQQAEAHAADLSLEQRQLDEIAVSRFNWTAAK
jgi:flagellar export protein FliJ